MEKSIVTERIYLSSLEDPSSRMNAYLAYPVSKNVANKIPSIVLCMDAFGLNSHIKEVAHQLAKEGYVVLVPDFFHRIAPNIELSYDEIGARRASHLIRNLQRQEVLLDVTVSQRYLQERVDTTEKMGVIGFSMGGHISYLAATQLPFRVAVSFYPVNLIGTEIPLSQPEPTLKLTQGIFKQKGQFLGIFAERDSLVWMNQIQQIQSALTNAKVKNEIVVFPGMDHGFFCNKQPNFHAASKERSWKKVLETFQKELK